MVLPKQSVAFNFTGVNTGTSARFIQPTELTELVNYRRTVDGELRKRLGLDKDTVGTFTGGTYLGPPSEMVANNSLMVRDSVGAVFSVETTFNQAFHKGIDRRAVPTWFQTSMAGTDGRALKPNALLVGDDIWQISLTTAGGTGAYQITVVDPVTRITKKTTTYAAGGAAMIACVVDQANTVWVFYVTHTTRTAIIAHRIFAIGGAPTVTTYISGLGGDLNGIDATVLTDGTIVVAASFYDVGGGFIYTGHWISKANGSTGVSASAATYLPAGVADTRTRIGGGLSLFGNGVDGNVYLSYWIPRVSADDYATLQLHTHVVSSLARTTVDLGNVSQNGLSPDPCHATSGGFLAANGDRVVYGTVIGDPSSGNINNVNLTTDRYTYNGSTVVIAPMGRSAYLAGKPFLYDGAYYFLTGFDDDIVERAQRTYFVRDADGNIVTTILDGEGAAIMHAGGLALPADASDPYIYHEYATHVVTPVVAGDKVYFGLVSEGLTANDPRATVAEIDFAAPCYSDLPNVLPGGVPKFVSAADMLRELAPLQFPFADAFDATTGGTATPFSVNFVSFTYATVSGEGATARVIESAPRAEKQITFYENTLPVALSPSYTLRVPTLRHVVGETWIFLYGSADGATDLFLQATVQNNPNVDYIDILIYPKLWDDAGPLLYSTGAAPEYQNPPAARLATYWRGRPWLWGTPDEQIWPGFEDAAGLGYRFNAVLSFPWLDGRTPAALCPAGFDALVLFKEDAIGLVTGPGPDGLGQGGYQVQTLSTKKGIRRETPGARVEGPLGVYFQNKADGRMNLVTGTSVIEIAKGQEHLTAYVVTRAVHHQDAGEIWFYCTNAKILVLDYRHPLPDQQAGQWYVRESGGLNVIADARVIDGAPLHIDAEGTSTLAYWTESAASFDDDDTEVLTTFQTGKMSIPGYMGEFDADTVQLSSTLAGGDSVYTITLTDSRGATEVHTDGANTTPDVEFRSALYRTRDLRMRVAEISATGEGRIFDGVTLILRPYGRVQNPHRRIA